MATFYATTKSALDEELVLDSEFYDPGKKERLSRLFAGSNYKISDLFEESNDLTSQGNLNFPYYLYDLPDTLGNLFSEGRYVDSADKVGSTKKLAEPGDFVISRLRYYLKEFAILPQRDYPPLLSTEYVVMRQKQNIDANTLLPFFLAKDIQYILAHSQRGSEHPRIANKDLLNLPLPDALISKAAHISSIINSAMTMFENTKDLYSAAESELLDRMEWDSLNLSSKNSLSYTKKAKDVEESQRLDPEFYQPKFSKLHEHLQKIGYLYVKDLASEPNRGVQPEYVSDGDIRIINSKHLGPRELDAGGEEKTSELFYAADVNSKARIKPLDVLMYSTGAYIGRTNAYLEDGKAIASNHVTIVRPNPAVCNPVYLSLFLNSPPGLMQSDQAASGSAQREIYPRDIANFKIYVPLKGGSPDIKWQNQIAEKVVNAHSAKARARSKLIEAVQLVESEVGALTSPDS